jgi:hypothetical protein
VPVTVDLDQCGFEPAERPKPNWKFAGLEDRVLIDEVKARGYMVVKKGLTFNLWNTLVTLDANHPDYQTEGYASWVLRRLCLGFAPVMMARPGMIKVTKRHNPPTHPHDSIEHRAQLTVIGFEP